MKNKLTDLNDHLFLQLERLGDTDITGEALAWEIERSKGIAMISKEIVKNASMQLEAIKVMKGGELTGNGNEVIATSFFSTAPKKQIDGTK